MHAGLMWAALFALFPGGIWWGSMWILFHYAARARRLPPFAEFDGQILKRWTTVVPPGPRPRSDHPSAGA